MKKDLRGKIREYIQSEDGKVGVKSPLMLGVAAGSVLLAQTIVGTPQAEAAGECMEDKDCEPGEKCYGPFNPHGSCGSA